MYCHTLRPLDTHMRHRIVIITDAVAVLQVRYEIPNENSVTTTVAMVLAVNNRLKKPSSQTTDCKRA